MPKVKTYSPASGGAFYLLLPKKIAVHKLQFKIPIVGFSIQIITASLLFAMFPKASRTTDKRDFLNLIIRVLFLRKHQSVKQTPLQSP